MEACSARDRAISFVKAGLRWRTEFGQTRGTPEPDPASSKTSASKTRSCRLPGSGRRARNARSPASRPRRRLLLWLPRVAKLHIRAPSDRTVALLVAEPGEAIVPRQPLMTLEKAGQRWASFNLREDQLNDLGIASRVELIPASGDAVIHARIDEIVPRGEFATWRAARAVGDHDLNTFLIRADPVERAESLQPGMTVLLPRQ
jgi:hypothetical protein